MEYSDDDFAKKLSAGNTAIVGFIGRVATALRGIKSVGTKAPRTVPTYRHFIASKLDSLSETLCDTWIDGVITEEQAEIILYTEAENRGLSEEYFAIYHAETVDSLVNLICSGDMDIDEAREILKWRGSTCEKEHPRA